MTQDTNNYKALNTLLDVVNYTLKQHPELLPYVEETILRASGFSYDFKENGEEDLILNFRLLNPKIVFDVGANVGDWTGTALEHFQSSTIHSFELSSSTFNHLTNNIKSSRVVLNNVGLEKKEGLFAYKDYGEDAGINTILLTSTFHDVNYSPKLITAQLRRGDAYCDENGIDFIDFLKIDVEGAEHLVLAGFEKMLLRKAVRLIQFEYGYINGDTKFLMRDFYEYFEKLGYITGRVRKGSIYFDKWTYQLNDFKSGPNYVAIRADDLELKNILSKSTQ